MSVQDLSRSAFAAASLERRFAELTILYDVSHALQKTMDQEKALGIILVAVTAGSGLGFNRAFVLLLDQEAKTLCGRLAIGPETPQEAFEIWDKLREQHTTLADLLNSILAAGLKKDVWINELVSRIQIPLSDDANPLINILKSHEAARAVDGIFMPHHLPVDKELTRLFGTQEFAVAPLFLAENDMGLLIADNAIAHAPIDVDRLRLLEIFAQEASVAIRNTQLCQRLVDQIKIAEDRTAILRESQQQLLQVERLAAMGRLATLAAFRLRAPLASIGGYARRLLRTMPHNDPRTEEMEIMIADVNRLERLVGEVLAYRRISRPDFKPTDVNALIRSVLATMQAEIQRGLVRVVLRLDPDIPIARIDELQVRQALMNLIANAVEAMPAGGTLTVTTSGNTRFLEIDIGDTGVGIAKQNWNKLFKPFFTTKAAGTGLGLTIVSQVAENHLGSLHFDSAPGMGTTFSMRLAAFPPQEAAMPAGMAAAKVEE
jgi:signal transduction histidine kinase